MCESRFGARKNSKENGDYLNLDNEIDKDKTRSNRAAASPNHACTRPKGTAAKRASQSPQVISNQKVRCATASAGDAVVIP